MSRPEVGSESAALQALIGRDAELARILKGFEAASAGEGRVVLICGEPGIGKTRLAREVLARAEASGARTCLGRSFEQHTDVPFFPFTEALTLPLIGPPLLPAAALQRWPPLERLLAEPGCEYGARESGGDTQLHVFRAVVGFLRAAAEGRPLVLLLDDLQWADETSLSLLLYLGRHLAGARLLVLGTYRESDVDHQGRLSEALGDLVRERLADDVWLRHFAPDQTERLLRDHLGGRDVSPDVVKLVHSHAEGNPFFTEELITSLIERGVVFQADEGWAARSDATIEVPRSVRSVVRQRLSRLADQTQALLQLASVMGQPFELEMLLSASGTPEPIVLDAVDEALVAGLVKEDRIARGAERYRFAHALIQQTLYDDLSLQRRRHLHLQIGDALEALSVGRRLLAAEISRHFWTAGHGNRAVDYAIDAGAQAAARYAHAEAAHHYELAVEFLEATGHGAKLAGAQYHLALELYDLNQVPEALSAYEAALRNFEAAGDTLNVARVHRGLGLLHEGRYDRAAAVEHFTAALRRWPHELQNGELGALLVEASRAMFYKGDCAAALSIAERAVALAEDCGDAALLGRALGRLATNRIIVDPRRRAAITLLDRAERIAKTSGEWRALARVYLGRADPHTLAGNLERALADRRSAVQAAERAGETERVAFAYANIAETLMMMGAWTEGREAARAGLRLDPRGLLHGAAHVGHQLTWMEGRTDAALDQLQAYVADARERADLQGVSLNLAMLADFLLQLDRPGEAEAPARAANGLLGPGGTWQPCPGFVCGVLAETLVQLDAPDMEETLNAAEHAIDETEQYLARPQVLRARGLLFDRRGQVSEALEALRRSAEVARAQGAGIQLGRTLEALVDAARRYGHTALAVDAHAELAALVQRIGPEVGALSWARRVGSRPVSVSRGAGSLTRREREVAVLLARGLTNREIADALVIADGTAGVHVDHILAKLGFRSRAQVAAWAVENGLVAGRTD